MSAWGWIVATAGAVTLIGGGLYALLRNWQAILDLLSRHADKRMRMRMQVIGPILNDLVRRPDLQTRVAPNSLWQDITVAHADLVRKLPQELPMLLSALYEAAYALDRGQPRVSALASEKLALIASEWVDESGLPYPSDCRIIARTIQRNQLHESEVDLGAVFLNDISIRTLAGAMFQVPDEQVTLQVRVGGRDVGSRTAVDKWAERVILELREDNRALNVKRYADLMKQLRRPLIELLRVELQKWS